jgi:hypothetical protein
LSRGRRAEAFRVAAAKNFAPFAVVFATPSRVCFARVVFAAKHTPFDVDYVR